MYEIRSQLQHKTAFLNQLAGLEYHEQENWWGFVYAAKILVHIVTQNIF